jgi:hypothetical protein
MKRNELQSPYKQQTILPRRSCQVLPLDRRLTYHKHIFAKWKQLGITSPKCIGYLDASPNSPQATNFSLIKQYLNQSELNGIQLWGMASTSNIQILKCFQLKALRIMVDAPWHILNLVIQRDLQTQTVKEICCSSQYSAHLSAHPNDLLVNLMQFPDNRRLQRHLPNDLPTRFLV